MDIKKRANQIAHRFQSRNPFEIVRGLNVILVDAPLSGVRGFISIFRETISSISMKLFPSRSAHWFWHTNLGICFSIKRQMPSLWIPELI